MAASRHQKYLPQKWKAGLPISQLNLRFRANDFGASTNLIRRVLMVLVSPKLVGTGFFRNEFSQGYEIQPCPSFNSLIKIAEPGIQRPYISIGFLKRPETKWL
jgi:hypothetical protein